MGSAFLEVVGEGPPSTFPHRSQDDFTILAELPAGALQCDSPGSKKPSPKGVKEGIRRDPSGLPGIAKESPGFLPLPLS